MSGDLQQTFRELTSKEILTVIRVKLLNENDQDLLRILDPA